MAEPWGMAGADPGRGPGPPAGRGGPGRCDGGCTVTDRATWQPGQVVTFTRGWVAGGIEVLPGDHGLVLDVVTMPGGGTRRLVVLGPGAQWLIDQPEQTLAPAAGPLIVGAHPLGMMLAPAVCDGWPRGA